MAGGFYGPDSAPIALTPKDMGMPEVTRHSEFTGVYAGSTFAEMLQKQDSKGRVRSALFTDVDWTFYRQDRAAESQELYDSLTAESYPIILVTGNDFSLMRQRIESGKHPYVPMVVGSAGTEVWILHEEDGQKVYKKDPEYEKLMQTNYDREKLGKEADTLIEDLKTQHPEWSFNYQRLDSDEETKAAGADKAPDYQPFKISFYAYASSIEESEAIRGFMEGKFPAQKIIVCEESNYNTKLPEGEKRKKYCVDISAATKGDAVQHVSEEAGIELKVVAGDNQNDLEMLSKGDVSVLVGGANPGVLIAIDNATPAEGKNKHFQPVEDTEGQLQRLVYREKGESKGPESISRAVRHLKSALRISKKIKANRAA